MTQKNPHPKPHGSTDIKEVLSGGKAKTATQKEIIWDKNKWIILNFGKI